MRYAALLFLSAVGVLLIFFARNRYEAANAKLAGLSTAQGIVTSIGSDGALHLKFRVAATDYEIERSVAINLFPRYHAGDTVPLIYNSDRPDTAGVRHWSEIYQDAAVLEGFGLAVMFMGVLTFQALGHAPARPALAAFPTPWGTVSLDHAIEIRHTRKELYTTLLMPLGLFALAYLACLYPYFVWRPWLSYTVAAILVLAGIGMIWGAFDTRATRILATQNGMEVKGNDGVRKFDWAEVASLQRETITRRVRHLKAIRNNTKDDYWYSTEEDGHSLILLDKSGKPLLTLDEDEPMEPLPDWLTLRAYIPQRTGLPVTEVTRESPLGERQGL
jgi:hypothetical protein